MQFLFIVLGWFVVIIDIGIDYRIFLFIGYSDILNGRNPYFIMRAIKLGKHYVEIYDSIDELPIVRFQKYNKMLLIDSGVGSDLSDFDNHIERAIRFCRTKPELAAIELENLRQSVYLIQSEVSPKHLAFCVLVKTFDGDPFNDLSDEGLQQMLNKLSDATNKEMTDQLDTVKKKIDDELALYYPNIFEDSNVKEYYDQLRSRTIAMLDEIITGENKQKEIEAITDLLLTFARPVAFHGSDSMEIQYDKQFESMCLMLSQKLNVNPKGFTVLEYYNAFEYLKDQAKPDKNRNRK